MIAAVEDYTVVIDRLSHLIGQTLHRYGLAEVATAALAVERARHWLQSEGREAIIKPVRVEDGVLILEARHAVALQEGQALLPDLLAALREELGPRAPKDGRLVRA